MNDIALTSEALDSKVLPTVPGEGADPLSEVDRDALRRAVRTLERPSLAARLSAAAGAPLDAIGRALPAPLTEVVSRSTETAMRTAMRVALATLPAKVVDAEVRDVTLALPEEGRLRRLLGSSGTRHKVFAAVSGAVSGLFGLPAVVVELPVSTTLMLRSIAEIAREEGEDLTEAETALACIQVFALGGPGGGGSALTESGYFAVRAALAKTMSEATRYAASRSLLDTSAPALVRFSAQVASRFGIVVSQKVAAQAVPILGAIGGAAVNTAFMDHFQSTARAHFTVRRLERRYGRAAVRSAYAAETEALKTAAA